jgi:hypothetical protein
MFEGYDLCMPKLFQLLILSVNLVQLIGSLLTPFCIAVCVIYLIRNDWYSPKASYRGTKFLKANFLLLSFPMGFFHLDSLVLTIF